MDSVIGSKGGKCLLTIHFVECSLMLAFLRDANTSKSVIDIMNNLDAILGKDDFSHYVKTCASQEIIINVPPTHHLSKEWRGGFSDYKKIERESTSLWHACNYHNTAEKTENQTACGLQMWLLVYKTGISDTKVAFRLQIFTFQIQKLHFELQSGISPYNSLYKLSRLFFLFEA